MENYTLEQLAQAQGILINRLNQARASHDYLFQEQARLIVGNVLGAVTADEIKTCHQQLEECKQVLEETPAALVIVKEGIEQLRSQEAQAQREAEKAQMRRDYFALRQEIIDAPDLAGKPSSGRLRGIVIRLADKALSDEYDELMRAAGEYNYRSQSEPFSFDVRITE